MQVVASGHANCLPAETSSSRLPPVPAISLGWVAAVSRKRKQPTVSTKLSTHLADCMAVLGQMLGNLSFHIANRTQFLLHVTILPAIEERAPCTCLGPVVRIRPAFSDNQQLEPQLAFRAALTSGFAGICMVDVKTCQDSRKNVPTP